MAKEKEKKFLVEFKDVPETILSVAHACKIQQGYLMLVDKQQLRVRLTDEFTSEHGFICYKNCLNDEERDEFEYEIPVEDAQQLLELSQCTIRKTRYTVKYKNGVYVEIDVYDDLNLIVCEIEYEGDFDYLCVPAWCTEEITGNKEYNNIQLARKYGNNKKKI